MQKIKKNLSAIQHKFQSLKEVHKMYDDPTPIGQAAQIMTYGVVRQQQVNQYLEYVHSQPQIEANLQINENWYDLNTQQMILLLDKVIKYRNTKKQKQPVKKERPSLVPYKKKKVKTFNKDTHQNPYIPPHIGDKKLIDQNQQYIDQNGQLRKRNQNQAIPQQSPYVSQDQEQKFPESQILQNTTQQKILEQNKKQIKLKQKQKTGIQSFIDLPEDFKSYPVEERFVILMSKYVQSKNKLEKKFNLVYKHYRKEMYVPHETFKANSDLLMDLRIFLKYYRDFDISKRFKTNEATAQFKKLAINGIWLDFQNFTQIHYRLIQIIVINDKILTQKLEQGQINDKKKSNQLKKQLSKCAKSITQNLFKLKQLTDLISDEQIKRLLNDNAGKKIINKIVEVHSGLIKQDILIRLKERIDQKKMKVMNGSNSINLNNKLKNTSPTKQKQNSQQYSPRSKPHMLSVYQLLQIPHMRSREMKKSSIYSALQLLNMHKQKQRLKQLINEQQNQKYLDAYFKKEKQLGSLARSNSISFKRLDTDEFESPLTQGSKSVKSKSIKQEKKGTFFLKNSVSLPRMKFS